MIAQFRGMVLREYATDTSVYVTVLDLDTGGQFRFRADRDAWVNLGVPALSPVELILSLRVGSGRNGLWVSADQVQLRK